jgi:CRP-like cAMP-binding protein
MSFRRLMLRNLHYLKDLNETIIDELICHMEVKRYTQGSVILKNGDVSSRLMFLRKGQIDVVVSNQISQDMEANEETELHFDVLNTVSLLQYYYSFLIFSQGSCFCAYSFICDDA